MQQNIARLNAGYSLRALLRAARYLKEKPDARFRIVDTGEIGTASEWWTWFRARLDAKINYHLGMFDCRGTGETELVRIAQELRDGKHVPRDRVASLSSKVKAKLLPIIRRHNERRLAS